MATKDTGTIKAGQLLYLFYKHSNFDWKISKLVPKENEWLLWSWKGETPEQVCTRFYKIIEIKEI